MEKNDGHENERKSTDKKLEEVDVVLGETQNLSHKFNLVSILSLAFCVLATWSTFAQDLGSGLNNGGPISILWGLCLVAVCNICVALSLGELVSSMPTALGQAYWTYRLWPTPTGRFVSYLCAWINTFGWWTLAASQVAFMTNFVLAMKVMYDPDWEGASIGWVQFLVYLGLAFLFTIVNVVACRRDKILPWFNNFVAVGFVALFFAISLALLICVGTSSQLRFQPVSFALGGWINNTGWSNGVVWFTGLVQAAYGLTAFDSIVHMIEEMPQPRQDGPRAIYLAVICGAISGFLFMVVCLFCIQDISQVLDSPTGFPFIQLVMDALGLNGGMTVIALFIFNGLGQGVSTTTTASRLTWSFSRDGGIPWFAYFGHVDSDWHAPVRAIWLQGFLIGLVGILYMFATTVVEAILSVSTIALTLSYGIPLLPLLFRGREHLPTAKFSLGKLGPTLNWVSVVYCAITTVFFFFPSNPNPSAPDMNYAIAVFGVMIAIALGFWVIQGRRTYLKTDDAELRMAYAVTLEDINGISAI